jgi:peptide/nickel transport system permease protein
MGSLVLIAVLYLVMIFAEFIAPYSPTTSFESMTYHPPNLRFAGGFKAQEARVANTVSWKYTRIRGLYAPVRFFAKGERYRLWGIIPMERHLFTTGPAVADDAAAFENIAGGTDVSESAGDSGGGYPIFLMGADNLGRDLFSRIVYGSRISLTIGFIATAISLFLAVLFGGLSGYSGGAVDWAVMRFSEFFMLIPGLYLILFLRSLLSTKMDSGQTYMMITIILSLVGWPGSARTLRGLVHAIKREEFVRNAQLEMVPAPVIVMSHIIPQTASLLIVSVALSIPGFIMTETTLSYLGLGIVDPAVSWGSLIKRDVTTLSNLRAYPWLLSPVWFLLSVTLAFNFLGDCLRDFFDPYHTIFRKRKSPASRAAPPSPLSARHASHTPLLEVRDLSVTFSALRGTSLTAVQAVRGVSFTVERGEVIGIVGESGSGKSVTTSAIPGLLPANAAVSGSILYEGRELLGLDTETLRQYRGKKIGMIFQEPGRSYDPLQNMRSVFFETFRNGEEAVDGKAADTKSADKKTAAKAVDRKAAMEQKAVTLLAETGLERGAERLSNFPHQFSGGQLQRIGIALALAQGCELLIADEPTTALDVTIQKQIIELLKSLQKSRSVTEKGKALSIIFISHNIDLVADISGRIIVMYGGLVMESGPAAAVSSNPQHPYTKALLAASPVLGSHYSQERLAVIPGRVTDPARPEPGCPFAPRCPRAVPDCAAALPPLAGTGENHEVRCLFANT